MTVFILFYAIFLPLKKEEFSEFGQYKNINELNDVFSYK